MFATIASVVINWLRGHPTTVEDVVKEVERLAEVLTALLGGHHNSLAAIEAKIAELEAAKSSIADETAKAVAAIAELKAIQGKVAELVPADSPAGHAVTTAGTALDDAALAGQVVQAVVGGGTPAQ